MKRYEMLQKLGIKNVTYKKIFYVHEIATVNLSKLYFLKNAKKTFEPNSHVLNRNWITDHGHDKYITTQELNKLTSENFTSILKQANLASKSDIANFVNKIDFDNKLKDFRSNKNELN